MATALFSLVTMNFMPMILPSWFDPEVLLNALGASGVWITAVILVVECAIFPILPGDSLLFTLGLFIAAENSKIRVAGLTGFAELALVWVILCIAAILGNVIGYYVGNWVGPKLFRPREGLMGKIFAPKRVTQTHDFMERYGPTALILARFVPFVRTFITMIAGMAGMSFRRFIRFTAIGGVLWVLLITTLGYFLGNVSFVKDNLSVALILIVLFSLVPAVVEYLRQHRKARSTNLTSESASEQ